MSFIVMTYLMSSSININKHSISDYQFEQDHIKYISFMNDAIRNATRVYYEKNDPRGTRVRICDNNTARIGYRGYYNRMTMDVGMVVISNPNFNASPLPLPVNLVLEKTDIEEEQCIMCYSNKRNLIFRPCNHNISCSECYLKFDKKLECPMCKGNIISLDK